MAIPEFELIEGKYEVLEKLREGGMGAVYKVRHRLLDEVRVIKVIRPQLEANDALRERFLREARSAVQLRHPNIATLHDFTVDEDGVAFMVMEFIDGEDLKRVVKRYSRLPVALALEVGIQTLRALRYLHSRHYIHRDISPDNVMLCRDVEGRLLVKLIDLGVAKSLESSEELTRDGIFVGKFRYGAPEQFGGAGLVIDQRTDLYALGVALYEVVTGSPPFPGESEHEIVAGHLFQPPRDFAETDPGGRVPAELRSALVKAMEKTPEDRFQNATEFGETLVEIQKSWQEPPDEPVIELVTSGEAGDSAAADGSTQRRLDYEFAPEATPPPIGAVKVAPRPAAETTEPSRRRTAPWFAAIFVLIGGLFTYLILKERGGATPSPALDLEPSPIDLVTEPVAPQAPPAEPVAEESTPPPAESSPQPAPPATRQPAPPARDPRPDALVREAGDLFRERRDREAYDRVSSAIALEPGNSGALRLMGEIAAAAEIRASRARSAAEAASAPDKASAAFGRASQAQQEAAAHRAAGRHREAIETFWSSADLFGRATRDAEETSRQEQLAAAREPEEQRQAVVESAPPPPPAAPAPEPEPPVDPTPQILETLAAFERAHEARDAGAVRALWPSLAGDRLRALTDSFAGAREIEMDLRDCSVQVRGATADASCHLSQTYRPRRGTRQSIEREVTFELSKSGDRWLIEDYS